VGLGLSADTLVDHTSRHGRMMDAITALHTAARRYCMDRAPFLDPRAQERGYHDRQWYHELPVKEKPSDPPVEMGARRAVAGDILYRVESVTPQMFAAMEALRAYLLEVGHATPHVARQMWQRGTRPTSPAPAGSTRTVERHGILTTWPAPPEKDRAMTEEQDRFCAYIAALSEEDLRAIAPLPYRRVLTDQEVELLWRRLERRWRVQRKHSWFIGHTDIEKPPPPHLLAFRELWFARQVPLETLRHILREHRPPRPPQAARIRRVYSLGFQGNAEMDLDLLIPLLYETYWFSERLDWLLYVSHERSITVAGAWLIDAIKAVWPQWRDHLYDGYLYDTPPPLPLLEERGD
jgi:hypothetical protein